MLQINPWDLESIILTVSGLKKNNCLMVEICSESFDPFDTYTHNIFYVRGKDKNLNYNKLICNLIDKI